LRSHFNGHLIGRSSNAPGANFHCRSGILDRPFKDPQRVFLGFGGDDVERSIKNTFRHTLLAAAHDGIDKLRDQLVPILGVRQDFSSSNFTFARHSILLRSFRPVLGTSLPPLLNPDGIQRATNDVIAHTREVFYAPAADQYHGVLLQIMTYSRNVRRHFNPVGQPNPRHFTQRRIRLFRGRGINTRADPAFLRTGLERGRGVFTPLLLSTFPDQLTNCRHRTSLLVLLTTKTDLTPVKFFLITNIITVVKIPTLRPPQERPHRGLLALLTRSPPWSISPNQCPLELTAP
jgi:hypothetical protein